MSTITTAQDDRRRTDRRHEFEALPPSEQLRGVFVAILVTLLAVVLQSLT